MEKIDARPRLMYGGDYNPEQWPEEMLERDLALMCEAGVNTVTLNVFGWSSIQPEPDRYDFARLDAAFDKLEQGGISVVLATPTAAPPAWMAQQDPTVLKVGEDGRRVAHWSRQAYCPNHPLYRREIRKIARALAERYVGRGNLALWHINNEYIVECYCDYCAEAFREWLRHRYGTLERLNEAWQLNQWSLRRTDWAQIAPPLGGMSHTSVSLDYRRFLSDSNLACFLAEKEEIVRVSPHVPVTTNFYSLDFLGQIHHDWAPHLDVVSWDSYPPRKDAAVWAAFQHDYFRGLKRQPFLLMEQATSGVNWKPYNPAKRPGVMRLQSYQALARGADAIMFFQFRQSRGGVEKFHSALVSHGTEADNRIFFEVRGLGEELRRLGGVAGAGQGTGQGSGRGRAAKVAVLYDVTLNWLVDWNKGSRDIAYRDAATAYYRPLYEANIPVDVVHPLSDLGGYAVVVAPMLYMFEEGVPERLRAYVEQGGMLVASYFSGMVDGYDVVSYGGYLRPIEDVFGIVIEENDALEPDMSNRIAWTSEGAAEWGTDSARDYETRKWGEVVRLNGAEALAVYLEDYYAGQPAVTRNRYGSGEAYYVSTEPGDGFIGELLLGICSQAGAVSMLKETPAGVEAVYRDQGDRRFLFLLNHRAETVEVDLPTEPGERLWADAVDGTTAGGRILLEGCGVRVLERAFANDLGGSNDLMGAIGAEEA
ncbi:beta-galactosidase [Cohnella sp. GCM10020058]|uniref:beta-galactosidase n=1 Tax=Cohnella sp. GCM10020058 TaxID=3317330 RepID=UPI0036276BEF